MTKQWLLELYLSKYKDININDIDYIIQHFAKTNEIETVAKVRGMVRGKL